jgi:hypothetical protein
MPPDHDPRVGGSSPSTGIGKPWVEPATSITRTQLSVGVVVLRRSFSRFALAADLLHFASLANATTVALRLGHMRTAGIAAVVVAVGLAASAAHAAPLTEGPWLFQSNYGGGKSRLMRVYVEVGGGQAAILGVSGTTRANCSKVPGRRTPVSYTAKNARIAIRGNGTFASKAMKLASSRGIGAGKVKLRGSIDSERVKGTLWLRTALGPLGICSTTESFSVKVQATPIS